MHPITLLNQIFMEKALFMFLVAASILSPVQKKPHRQSVFVYVGLPIQTEIGTGGPAERSNVEPVVSQDGLSHNISIHLCFSLAEAQLTFSTRNLNSPLIQSHLSSASKQLSTRLFFFPEGLLIAKFGWLVQCQLFSVCLATVLAPSASWAFCWYLLAAERETNPIYTL